MCDLTALDADDDGVDDLALTNMDCDDGDATTVGDDDGSMTSTSCGDDCDCDDNDSHLPWSRLQ